MIRQNVHELRQTLQKKIIFSDYSMIISYAEELDNHTVEFLHRHREFELIYVLEGEIRIQIAGDSEQEHLVKEGECIFLNANVPHYIQYHFHKPNRYFTILFSMKKTNIKDPISQKKLSDIGTFDSLMRTINGKSHIIFGAKEGITKYIENIRKVLRAKDWGYQEELSMLYAAYIIAQLGMLVPRCNQSTSSDIDNTAIAITTFLHNNYQDPNLSIQQLSDHLHISTRHLNRIFQDYFGTTLIDTLATYRINYAKNYILGTNDSLDTIAEKVGMTSASVLSRLFKKKEGMTINQYRKEYRLNTCEKN